MLRRAAQGEFEDRRYIAEQEVSPGKAGGFSFGAAQSGLSISHQTKRPFDSVECSTPHDLLIRCSLSNLQFPAIALTWCGLTSHRHRSIEPFFMSLAARDSEFRRWSGRVDRRICQTFAASPAEPGGLPLGFRRTIQLTALLPTTEGRGRIGHELHDLAAVGPD